MDVKVKLQVMKSHWEETKAVMAMKEKLPNYVIDSFIAAGFDTLEVISEIDTSSEYDLQEIEQFITDEHIGWSF